MGSLPGHAYANVRQPPVSTLNLAHMIPLSAVWAGPARDEHFQAPPLFFVKTEGSTPFRFSLHVGDVGHTLIVGPTGAGKSVLLSIMAMQFRRYRGAQIFAFDFGGSIRTAALAIGWRLARSRGQPLKQRGRFPSRSNRWRTSMIPPSAPGRPEWVTAILAKEGVLIDPTAKEHVWSALSSLASSPTGERTITGLACPVAIDCVEAKHCIPIVSAARPAGCSTLKLSTWASPRCRPSRLRA